MGAGRGSPTVAGGQAIAYGPTGYKGIIKEPRIFGLACFASIGGFLFGYDQGVISGVLVMNSFVSHCLVHLISYHIKRLQSCVNTCLVSIMTLGAMCGAFANGPISDSLSRRWSILCANIVFLIGSVIQCAAENVAMLFVGRFVFGCAVGMLAMVVPLYLSELATPNNRDALVALQQLSVTLGIMSSFWINYGTQYIGVRLLGESPFALQCLPSAILAIGTFFLPYSPRREEEAKQVLVRLRRLTATDYRLTLEFLEIKAARVFDEESRLAKYGDNSSRFQIAWNQYKELFTVPHLRRRTTIACLLQILQQFTGINAVIYYAPQFFEAIGLRGNSVNLLATGVVGIVFFICTIPAVMYLDQWGRRKTLILGSIGMSIAELIVATFIACVNWVMPSEMFPPATRGKAVGVAIAANYLSNFIVALITPWMLQSITFGTFYFFLVFSITLGVWTYFCVPETNGVPIEEMDTLFGGNEGEADLQRIASIRARLGFETSEDRKMVLEETKHDSVEHRERVD
ncbi:sugar and other transporter-domain-containing protein [Aspergillus flavus]|uniref:Sugar and other transporter-domain-containing protein n=1 Tax=Aspergillus flavus (strain ATCC 200026 / FGSC A1120 / IAM 13836 / NRRL 3357 / JCM 12722 / SRRC 167) TaxID=332952 RepID=A0A7U2MPE2_ASPFN|nr:sugar and other transporter-domain-containing protein [Aspergillus flavus]